MPAAILDCHVAPENSVCHNKTHLAGRNGLRRQDQPVKDTL